MQLRYPSDVATANSTYITFTRLRNRGFKTSELKTIDKANFEAQPTDIIALPVPNEFVDSGNIGYSNIQDTSLLGKGAKNVLNKVPGADLIQQEAKIKTAQTSATQQMLLFDSVSLKIKSFSWTLIPESQEEANAIVSIVQQFELAKLPSYSLGTEILNFPDVFKIKFGGVKPKLITFLPSVITDITCSYGNGHFQLYETGDFPEIQLSLTVGELVSRTREIQERLYGAV